ncbi:MAG: hypothetical protein JRI52_09375 [Deltaproteobacteria bacterium]|nr:hypothetical protein [Deltaproteobacteria bacterium]
MKKVGFVSTRISGTDGVSLETYKWYQVLERNRFECYFFAGELDTPKDRSFLSPKPTLMNRRSKKSTMHVLEPPPATGPFQIGSMRSKITSSPDSMSFAATLI